MTPRSVTSARGQTSPLVGNAPLRRRNLSERPHTTGATASIEPDTASIELEDARP